MRRSITVAILGALALTACTPEQLATWEQINGSPFTEAQRSELAALPDSPLVLGALTVNPDGSMIENRAPSGSKCPQHYGAAMRAGWKPSHWARLDYIMWRESRCNPRAYNGRGRDDSYSLLQLNMRAHRSWVGPLVGWDFSKLYDPETNLRIGKVLYDKARRMYGCGWQPWRTTRQRHWCN